MIVTEDEDTVDDVSTVILIYIVKLYCIIIFLYSLQIISPQLPISLDDVELAIEGDIDNDDYITNAMEAIETYNNVSILLHIYIHVIINYFTMNNNSPFYLFITDECTANTTTTCCDINITQPQ